ncbi:MAG: hypothetical protein IIC71_06460 [Acidobacteria bacterium]|nr:hypothetical protein [Acidobacteriota bacterium]
MTANDPSHVWEHVRGWATMRSFVYYQRENFLPQGIVTGRDVVDYSAGLGDLSSYAATLGPRSLLATAPEPHAPRPAALPQRVRWQPGVGATHISRELGTSSADVILARMVIQFPTVEQDAVDVDAILEQMHTVLRDDGSIVVTTHAHFSLPRFEGDHSHVADHLAAVGADVAPLIDDSNGFTRGVAQETAGLIELIRYLDLPPREGPFGRTGFGLKIPMLVNSFIRAGFDITSVEVIEPFTFPIGLQAAVAAGDSDTVQLGKQVMAIKRRYLTLPAASDPYQRPHILASMIAEIRKLIPITTVPIVRVCATKK